MKLKELVKDENAARQGKPQVRGALPSHSKLFEDHQLATLIEQKFILIQILDSTHVQRGSIFSKSANKQLLVESTKISDLKNNEDKLENLLHWTKNLRSEIETMQMEHSERFLGDFLSKRE
jgi:hypothetical protein